jgi:hypothetical protein
VLCDLVLREQMDVIKVRLQTQSRLDGPARYTGFTQAFSRIWREEGYRRGLMRGFTASMVREASYSSMRMGLYDACKILLSGSNPNGGDFSLLTKIAAGSFSGALGSLIAVPTDLIKIRFQGYSLDKPNPYPHSWAAFVDVYKRGGVRGLYSGATPTVARAAILTGSQLSSYDHSKRAMLRSGLFADTPSTHLIASIISGFVTCTAVNPADGQCTGTMTRIHSASLCHRVCRWQLTHLCVPLRSRYPVSLPPCQ